MSTQYRISYADGHTATYESRDEAELHARGARTLCAASAEYAALPAYQVVSVDEIAVPAKAPASPDVSPKPRANDPRPPSARKACE